MREIPSYIEKSDNDIDLPEEYKKNYLPISLGGMCLVAGMIRTCYQDDWYTAYPFDYIRIVFSSIISILKDSSVLFENISQNNVENNTMSYNKHVFFVHHNINDINVKKKFIDRIEKLKNTLNTTTKTVIFYRLITKEHADDEIKQVDSFINYIDEFYPNLNYKLIFVKDFQKHNGFIKHINKKTTLWSVSYNDCILYDNKISKEQIQKHRNVLRNVIMNTNLIPIDTELIPSTNYVYIKGKECDIKFD